MISFKAPALAILFAGMLATSVSAADTFAIPAASGHPWNNEARSNFIINDNAVQVSGATWRAWVTFLQLPSTATSVTVTKAFFPRRQQHRQDTTLQLQRGWWLGHLHGGK